MKIRLKEGVRVTTRRIPEQRQIPIQRRYEEVTVQRIAPTAPYHPLTAEGDDLFKEVAIELSEVGEEPVVSKQAKVVEEVQVFKEIHERAETIRDTIRRSDVEVEHLSGQAADDDHEYRRHWSSIYGARGLTYDQYGPAYRYGSRPSGTDWTTLEPEARRSLEQNNPGTWEKVKNAVRYSWERGKQTLQRKVA